MAAKSVRGWLAAACCVTVTASGCSFGGVTSLPLPGTVGTGKNAITYRVEIANIGTLEPNSPVMLNDVVVGAVRTMTVDNWQAKVVVSVQPDTVVPANALATVGQTSLLGSMHLALDPPAGEEPVGRLAPGSTVPINRSSTYPSTEQTLATLSMIVNGGGLTQIGDIVHNFTAALTGDTAKIRSLLTRMNEVVGILDTQQGNIIAATTALDRLAGTFADQRDVIVRALDRIPPALAVLTEQRPQFTTALQKLGNLSAMSHELLTDAHDDLVRNLRNLEPTVRALADVGPDLVTALTYLPTYPYTQEFVDRGIRGDYMNQFIVFDFTIPRLKNGILLGTRWAEPGASMVPAPGDPWYANYTLDPLKAPVTPVPSELAPLPQQVDPEPGTDAASPDVGEHDEQDGN